MRTLILILLLLAFPALADTLNDQLEDAGKSVTASLRPGQVRYHSATGTESLDVAIGVAQCGGGIKIWFNPDYDGTNVTATYTLYDCPRQTTSANYASECLPLKFDPDGGGADTNIMRDDPDSLILYSATPLYLGATITAGTDTAQATIRCLR
jgi:hypothetical protein